MQQHCNDNLSGEALMMIKEHFIERYGVPAWTIGFGGSGGAIQQLLIAQNFPGPARRHPAQPHLSRLGQRARRASPTAVC